MKIQLPEVKRMSRDNFNLTRVIIIIVTIFIVVVVNYSNAQNLKTYSPTSGTTETDEGFTIIPQRVNINNLQSRAGNRTIDTVKTCSFGSKYANLYTHWIGKKFERAKQTISELVKMNTTYVEFYVKWENIELNNDIWLWDTGEDTLMNLLIYLTSFDLVPIILIKANYWENGSSWAVDGVDRKENYYLDNTTYSYAPFYYISGVAQPPRAWSSTDPGVSPAGTMDEYYEFVFELMKQYKEYVHYYEIENEPGRAHGEFLGDLYDYYAMMKQVRNASNQISKQFFIKINVINAHMGMSDGNGKNYPKFNLVNLFDFSEEYKDFFDILSWHNNNFGSDWDTGPDDDLETIDEDIELIRNIFASYGVENKTIFNTESSIQIGFFSELPKRTIIDLENDVVPFENYISSKEERPDYDGMVKTYGTIVSTLGTFNSVEELQLGDFKKPYIYGYKVMRNTKSGYVLWSESDIARLKYGGEMVYFTSEDSDSPALNIINGTREKWESKKGFVMDQEFIISFRENKRFDINRITLQNHYFNKHGQNSSAQNFELWYTTGDTWASANWKKIQTFYSYDKGLLTLTNKSANIVGDVTSWKFADLRAEYDQVTITNSLQGNNGNYTIEKIKTNRKILLSRIIAGGSENNLSYLIDNIPSDTLKRYWLNPDLGADPAVDERPFVYLKEQEFYFNNHSIIDNVSYIKLVINNNYEDLDYISLNSFKIHKADSDVINFSSELSGFLKVTDIHGKQSIVASSELELSDSPIFVEFFEPFDKPDLVIDPKNISFTPENFTVGENVTITSIVRNIGTAFANSANVTFYDGIPDLNGTLIGKVKTITNITIGSQKIITSDSWNVTEGLHEIYIRIFNCTPKESNITNNIAFKHLSALPKPQHPDLRFEPSNITFSNNDPVEGEIVYINTTVYNAGSFSALFANVSVYIGNPNENGTLLGDVKNITKLPANDWINITSNPWTAVLGTHEIFILISDTIPQELNVTNNLANRTITVNPKPVLLQPDLRIIADNISFFPTKPVDGDTVTIRASISNLGDTIAEFANVSFYIGDPEIDGEQIGAGKKVLNLTFGSQITISSSPWSPINGEYDVYVLITDVRPSDSNISNNKANKIIKIGMEPTQLDLSIGANGIIISDEKPTVGDLIIVTARILVAKVTPQTQILDVAIEFSVDNIIITNVMVSLYTSPIEVIFNWTAEEGEHTIGIKLDPENILEESNEKNNFAEKQIIVLPTEPEDKAEGQFLNYYNVVIIIAVIVIVIVLIIIIFSLFSGKKKVKHKTSEKKVDKSKRKSDIEEEFEEE